jgi:hypothetical protein
MALNCSVTFTDPMLFQQLMERDSDVAQYIYIYRHTHTQLSYLAPPSEL